MSAPKSSTAQKRELLGGKVLRTVWRRLYRFTHRLGSCGECAVVVFIASLCGLLVVGVLK